MRAVLKRGLVIIQGPPGTGKTFVGSHIARMLLKSKNNLKIYSGPIFLICFTNHALDQFLLHIMAFTKRVLRLGSQSRNPELKQ